MPVMKDNIPTQEDLKQIDADIELLIGINAANVMEPWQVIYS